MKPMTYERKITLTRQALSRLDLAPAAKALEMQEEASDLDHMEVLHLPEEMIMKLTEHRSRGPSWVSASKGG